MDQTTKINMIRTNFKIFEPTVYLFPTMRCNLNCRMCYSGSPLYKPSGNELSDDEYSTLVDDLIDLGFKRFDISGGEPLLRCELIYKLAKKIRIKNAKLQLVTNGTLLTSILSKNKIQPDLFDFIAVSLDSPNEETYNKIRGANAYKSVILGIKKLVSKRFNVGINTVCMAENKNQIGELLHLAKHLGVNFIHLLRNRQVSPLLDPKSTSFKIEWLNIYEKLQENLYMAPNELLIIVNLPQYIHSDFTNKLRSNFRDKKNILILTDCISGCGAFNRNIAITSTGNVTGCVTMINEAKFWIGNISKIPLIKILKKAEKWTSELDKRNKNLHFDSICTFCSSYHFCKGGCPAVAEKCCLDWSKRDPSCNKI